ncbi:alpha/beta fold hydrolase [Streptomyces sp. NPDC049555]|uniref:alpha/beta fold hydrolase n=1 Tax=Streptomyces sp. NPDC049555 TaxID=3154930 RepID=UPI0034170F9F
MVAPIRVHLVFVHGLFSSAKVWSAFRQLISTDPELTSWVDVHCFEYDSKVVQFNLAKRIGELDDIADQLGSYLETKLADAEAIVLVTHSQGGLVVQRFLSRRLAVGKGRELTRIKHFLMFSCPNTGSGFFLTVRKFLAVWRHPQERQLRPFDRYVLEAQRAVLTGVVHARRHSEQECPIPVRAYGATSDNIVPPYVARGVFPEGSVIDGDHFSVVQPADLDAAAYLVVRQALQSVGRPRSEPRPLPAAVTAPPSGNGHSVAPPFAKLEGNLKGEQHNRLVAQVTSAADPQKVHVLAGLGGTGKSRLALEIADRAHRAGRRVWWVSVSQLSSRMRAVASQLGASEAQLDRAWHGPGSATDLLWDLLDRAPQPWLLVLDNADDPQQLGPVDGPVSDGTGWLREPESEHGLVVVTSRVRSQETWGTWSRVHRVCPLDDEEGASMLLERTDGVGGTNEQARRLSAVLGGLPLALLTAAATVKAVSGKAGRKMSLDDGEVRDFDSYRKAVKRRFESAPGSTRAGMDLDELLGREIVEEVYGIALRQLIRHDLPQAAPLLKVFACLNIAPIPYRCLVDGAVLARSPLFPGFSPAQRTAVLRGLEDFALVDADEREDVTDPALSHVLTLHPVVHGVLREDGDVQQRRTEYYGLAVSMLLHAADGKDPDHPSSWPLWTAIAPHARAVARACLLGPVGLKDRSVVSGAIELTRLTARFLITRGLLVPANDLVVPVVEACTRFGFHEDDREILALRHEKGRIALEREDHAAAEQEFARVVAARRRVLGESDPDTLASRHKHARAVCEQGRWEAAEPLLRSIVQAENHVRGAEHSDTLVVRHTLARTMLALGRATEAEQEARSILEISRRHNWPPTTSETLFVRSTLARSLLEQDRYEDAEEEIRGALRDDDRPRDSERMMHLRDTLATVLLGQGRAPEAVQEFRDLLADLRRVKPGSPMTRRVEQNLDEILRQMPGQS